MKPVSIFEKSKKYKWHVDLPAGDTIVPTIAYAGILLMDNGPKITDLNSIYLKYKTVPSNEINPQLEINMLVLVDIYEMYLDYYREYAIKEFSSNKMTLQYVGKMPLLDMNATREDLNDEVLDIITATKKNHEWIIDPTNTYHKYKIIKIGGFGEGNVESYPR